MTTTSSAPPSESPAAPPVDGIAPVRLYALDHGPWLEVQRNLGRALDARKLGRQAAPITVILNDLLDGAVKTMHLQVFRRTMEAEFGLTGDDNGEQLKALFATELSEHGSQNLARACEAEGW